MTLAQLRYTIAIAKAGSMNEAAKSLYISQPSLSTAIRELEAETGVEIFRRTNRGIGVTPAGEEFLGYARQVVEQYELMEAKYISKEQSRKKFSVSMQHYTFAVNAFVELVKQFGMDCGPRIAGGVDEIGAGRDRNARPPRLLGQRDRPRPAAAKRLLARTQPARVLARPARRARPWSKPRQSHPLGARWRRRAS